MFPFVWSYRGRVLLALSSLILAKLAMVSVPFVLKHIVDNLGLPDRSALVLPLALLLSYGALRLVSSMFNELRDAVFARVRFHAMRQVSDRVLQHLHNLSLRYHLERRTGGVSRDLERGASSVSSILNYLVFNILPTAAEFTLVAAILISKYETRFSIAIFGTVTIYIIFTFLITEWRMHYRHEMNRLDSKANSQAIDSLLNYETVKYFNNERLEQQRYDGTLTEWENAAVKSQTSMSLLNFGQGTIIAVGVTFIMIFAGQGVVQGQLTVGDLVLVNTLMLQLFLPLGFLGIIYRQLKYALADMDLMFKLLDREAEIKDNDDANELVVSNGVVRFESVDFAYQPDRQILHQVSFDIPAGHKIAIVGPSGSGKSTIARLLFRFYNIQNGRILIDGQDISQVTQDSLRRAIGIVPQDTVLFNDTIYYNIQYARPEAGRDEVIQAARMAHIHHFIESLPQGYETLVGERGLKLSGGEKQRVAIARVILKNPRILIFDEATSNLDSQSEQAILSSLHEVAQAHTTLVIAHRLSTIIDADRIYVIRDGRILESGRHKELLANNGLYTELWTLQQEERQAEQLQTATAMN
ncbi:MAG: ATP-binding cassette domain-containing protein [Gammaproteobacteria bacterium]|nr:ATP-binding cassette domain-containing protein [Gammaproteobacteria bacterium]